MNKINKFAALSLAVVLMSGASIAQAKNAVVEDAIKSRPELSSFYEGLVNTGVINELQSGVSYTVFAPTNEAMAEISRDKYPCFYSAQCKEEIADILRNHITVGEVNFATPNLKSVFSIDKRQVAILETSKGNYSVDGHKVVSQNQLLGNVLHEIDGVIASKEELALVSRLKTPVATNVEKKTITEKVYYAPDGVPDGASKTTVTTVTEQR